MRILKTLLMIRNEKYHRILQLRWEKERLKHLIKQLQEQNQQVCHNEEDNEKK